MTQVTSMGSMQAWWRLFNSPFAGNLYQFQFNGLSATALQVAYDSASGSSSRAASVERMNVRSARVASTRKQVFRELEK